jgi:hypothetical protein
MLKIDWIPEVRRIGLRLSKGRAGPAGAGRGPGQSTLTGLVGALDGFGRRPSVS